MSGCDGGGFVGVQLPLLPGGPGRRCSWSCNCSGNREGLRSTLAADIDRGREGRDMLRFLMLPDSVEWSEKELSALDLGAEVEGLM